MRNIIRTTLSTLAAGGGDHVASEKEGRTGEIMSIPMGTDSKVFSVRGLGCLFFLFDPICPFPHLEKKLERGECIPSIK